MAEIINLRMARKAKMRAGKAVAAEANRAKYGESKDGRRARKAEDARNRRLLDGHKLERD